MSRFMQLPQRYPKSFPYHITGLILYSCLHAPVTPLPPGYTTISTSHLLLHRCRRRRRRHRPAAGGRQESICRVSVRDQCWHAAGRELITE